METRHLYIARIRFFLRTKKLCIHMVLMNNLPPMKKLSWDGGSKVCHIRSLGNPHGQNWVGGVTPCTKRVSSSSVTEFYHCLCAKPSLRSISNQYSHINIEILLIIDYSHLIYSNAFSVGGVTKCRLKKICTTFVFGIHPHLTSI